MTDKLTQSTDSVGLLIFDLAHHRTLLTTVINNMILEYKLYHIRTHPIQKWVQSLLRTIGKL